MAAREQYPERNSKIVAMRKAGMWPRAIARELGLSHNVVIGVCNRAGLSGPDGHKECLKGEDAPNAALTQEAVEIIRREWKPRDPNRSQVALAVRFGVTPMTVWNVIHRKTWGA
jgi:hypothetical protein